MAWIGRTLTVLLVSGSERDPVAESIGSLDPAIAVATERTVADAVERVEHDSIDCVVAAASLPDGDGVTLLVRVREADGSVPVVLCGADPDVALVETALDRSVTEWLPVDLGAGVAGPVADRVDAILLRHRRERILRALQRASRELIYAEDETAVADVAVRTAHHVIGLPMTTVFFHDESADLLVPVSTTELRRKHADPPQSLPIDGSISGRAFREGSPVVFDTAGPDEELLVDVDDVSWLPVEESDILSDPENPMESGLMLPLGDHGTMGVVSTETRALTAPDVRFLGILTDSVVAALDRADREAELARKNRQLTDFASIVSHDLRNPIAVAAGNLEAALETGDREHVEEALAAVDRMDDIVEDVLTLVRTDDVTDDAGQVDLAAAVRRAWETVETNGTELRLDGDLPTVAADRGQTRELLENLFRNCVDHGPEDDGDGASVTVRAGSLDGEATGFYVADDGRGLPNDEYGSVFETGYTTSTSGTGLGLSIVARIAEAHGWSVTADESASGGFRVEVRTDCQ